jgi:ankyrin repeat protein
VYKRESKPAFLLPITFAAVIGSCWWWLVGPDGSATAAAIDLERANAEANVVHPNGRTALMLAAKNGDIDRVEALLEAGADVNRTNKNGGTPLMYAVLSGKLELVELLLNKGARMDHTAKNGWGALMVAVTKGYTDITSQLLSMGADANLPDVYGWTPLMRAVFEKRTKIVRILLADPRTNPDLQGENGITALHIAASQGLTEIAQLLTAARARTDIKDHDGRTPYAVAEAANHHALLSVLKAGNQ